MAGFTIIGRSYFEMGLLILIISYYLNKHGRLPKAQNINASYHQLQKKLGSESKFGTHTFRHTLATLMIADKSISLAYISRYLGHASTAIMQKYYIGLLPEQVVVEERKVL